MKTQYSIEISYNYNISKYLRKSTIRSLMRSILKSHGVLQAEISVAIVDKLQMIEVNKQYLDSDAETDVIAFDFNNPESSNSTENNEENNTKPISDAELDVHDQILEPEILDNHKIIREKIDGEIIINGELAVRIAANFNHEPAQEIQLYIIHGLLHIIGYDDLNPSDKKIMWAFQKHYMEMLCNQK